MSVTRTILVAGGSFDPFYVHHDDDQLLSRAAARTAARARRLPTTTFKFFCSVNTAFSVDCYGWAKLSIRPATESTLVLFASAGGTTSKWVSSPKPLSASEILGVIMWLDTRNNSCGECDRHPAC
jgi:hypothetical protein